MVSSSFLCFSFFFSFFFLIEMDICPAKRGGGQREIELLREEETLPFNNRNLRNIEHKGGQEEGNVASLPPPQWRVLKRRQNQGEEERLLAFLVNRQYLKYKSNSNKGGLPRLKLYPLYLLDATRGRQRFKKTIYKVSEEKATQKRHKHLEKRFSISSACDRNGYIKM